MFYHPHGFSGVKTTRNGVEREERVRTELTGFIYFDVGGVR
jgi:hypothetical protein